MNSYFASVEQQANPFLRGKPVGITGKRYDGEDQPRSVITTASIEAKCLGVKTAMSTWEAKRMCPSLILYPGDPEKYSDIMHRFNGIFHDFTHKVEKFSVDESFLDVTEVAGDYLGATCTALAIRERLREQCGERITASIGIGPSKLVAKLAGESVKPNGLTAVQPHEVLAFMDTCALQDLCGIGPRIERRLNSLGIINFAQLRAFPRDQLENEFGRYGLWLHEAAYGRESAVVLSSIQKTNADDAPKSVGHSYTLARDTNDPREVKRYLLLLCDKVAWRLRRDGLMARRVKAYVRFGNFSGSGQQRIFQTYTADGLTLFANAWRIIRDLTDFTVPIRLVGISASELCRGTPHPPLFLKERKLLRLTSALDRLQHRYGSGVWNRTTVLHTNIKPRSSGFHFDHEI